MACIKHLHRVSWPAQTCKDLTDVTISSLACVTITLPVICYTTSPTPIGLSLGFLLNSIKQHAWNTSKED